MHVPPSSLTIFGYTFPRAVSGETERDNRPLYVVWGGGRATADECRTLALRLPNRRRTRRRA